MFTGDIIQDCSIMYTLLEEIPLRSGSSRRRLCKQGASVLYGHSWKGFLKYDENGHKICRVRHPTEKGMFLTQLKANHPYLQDYFNEFRDLHFPGFQFSQVMINKNYPVKKHKDTKNVGVSTLISFGDYTGGKTRVYTEDKIIDYDSNCNPVQFNGSLYEHEVLPYTGERYALVFFK